MQRLFYNTQMEELQLKVKLPENIAPPLQVTNKIRQKIVFEKKNN